MKGSYTLKGLFSAQAGLRTYYLRLRRIRYQDPRFIVFSTIPKTGSTFLTRTMASLTGYEHSYLAFAYKNIEQELYLPRMIDSYGKGVIVHQHFKANDPNMQLLQEFSIRPVVLVRNAFDVIVSLRDHLNRYALDNIPSLLPPTDFSSLKPSRQLDWVITYFSPWIIEYYVSWAYAEKRGDLDFFWYTYEQLCRDWPTGIGEICAYMQLEFTAEKINLALDWARSSKTAMSKFNKGKTGRGRSELSEDQENQIRAHTKFYPDVDFSRIGL